MKIGFFGGCFNPPTIAHIELAKKVLNECKLDKVIFVPVGDFYKKRELAPAIHRYNMLEIECNKINNIEVSDLELNIKENLYAIDAFKLIQKEYPNDELYFLMGADNFIHIMSWKDGEELIKRFKYIVLERENTDVEKFIETNLKEYMDKITLIKNEEYKSLSSSKFREDLKEGKKDSKFIHNDIIEYIEKNNLYKM